MDLLRERLKARGALCAVLCGGDESSSTTTTTQGAQTTTNNYDKRVAVEDGIGVTGDGNNVSYNSSDAVNAIAQAGAAIIESSGGAVVDLYKNAGAQNTDAWNKTITQGAALVDKLIDKVGDGFSLAEKTVDSFMPSENKQTDALKWGLLAAAAVAAAVLLKEKK